MTFEAPAAERTPANRLRGMKMTRQTVVAVVDNDRGVLSAIGRLLRAHGLRVESFASVGEFLARSSTEALACLVLDIDPGSMSGFALLHCLKAGGSPLPVIIITAADDESARRRAIAAGCVAYLRKPFSAEALLAAIGEAAQPTGM
jgi:FixJ family two-component response regulator